MFDRFLWVACHSELPSPVLLWAADAEVFTFGLMLKIQY
jgi:hypothetical protein